MLQQFYLYLKIASIGPTILDPHSDREWVDLDSVFKVLNIVEKEVIGTVAKDISDAIAQNGAQKWFLGLSETIYDHILEKVSKSAKETLFLGVKKDLVKTDKSDLIKIFKK